MNTSVTTTSVRDLLHYYTDGIYQLPDTTDLVNLPWEAAGRLLESVRIGHPIGAITVIETWENNRPLRTVVDGVARLGLLVGALLPPAVRPRWAPPWISGLALVGLGTDDIQIEIGSASPHQLPTWALLNTMDFLRWQRRLRQTAPADILDRITSDAEKAAQSLLLPVPVIVCSGTTDQTSTVRKQANIRLR